MTTYLLVIDVSSDGTTDYLLSFLASLSRRRSLQWERINRLASREDIEPVFLESRADEHGVWLRFSRALGVHIASRGGLRWLYCLSLVQGHLHKALGGLILSDNT